MTPPDAPHFPADASAADPRVREQMAAQLRQFHQAEVRAVGQAEMLKVYCRALTNWVLNPNTDPYHIERLFDEVCHVARLDSLDDWDG